MAPKIVWRHYSAVANQNGVAWVGTGNGAGTHAISAGGFAAANDESTIDEVGSTASAQAPMVGTLPRYDAATDTTYWMVGFAAPPGARLRTHVFAVLA